jgi:hypothetical protein
MDNKKKEPTLKLRAYFGDKRFEEEPDIAELLALINGKEFS